MTNPPDLNTASSWEIIQAYEALPEPTEIMVAKGAHILSEWLDDAAPLHERRYRDPAKALLRFSALYAPAASTDLLVAQIERLTSALTAIAGHDGLTLISVDLGKPYSVGAADAFAQLADIAKSALAETPSND